MSSDAQRYTNLKLYAYVYTWILENISNHTSLHGRVLIWDITLKVPKHWQLHNRKKNTQIPLASVTV